MEIPMLLNYSLDTAACYYIPNLPRNIDAHGQEYGDGQGTHRTDAAISAVFGELLWLSTQWAGQYTPLSMGTVLNLGGTTGSLTLQDALYQFVRNWKFQNESYGSIKGEYAANRRNFADAIAVAILSSGSRTALPTPNCSSGPVWLGGSLFFADIQTAYNNLSKSGAMKITHAELSGNINFNNSLKNFPVILSGGYDCSFIAQNGVTDVNGSVTIGTGTLVIDNIVIK